MKFITALAFLLLSTSLFAATPYSFKCTTASDGSCPIDNTTAHVMKIVDTNIYGGTEGEYNLFLETDTGASYMYVFKAKTLLAQSANATYLAVPTSNGFVGVIMVDSVDQMPAFIEPKL